MKKIPNEEQIKNEILQIKIKYLEKQLELKNKEIIQQRRIRNALKLLLLGIDKAIQAQINSLKAAPRPKSSRFKPGPITITTSEPYALLSELENEDLKTYYSNKRLINTRLNPIRYSLYLLLSSLYFVLRWPARKLVRGIRRK